MGLLTPCFVPGGGRVFVHNDCPRGTVFVPSSPLWGEGMATDEIDSHISQLLVKQSPEPRDLHPHPVVMCFVVQIMGIFLYS